MRTFLIIAIAVACAVGACNWTEFDNLADEMWVEATEKPDVKSSEYGVAIIRGDIDPTSGGKLVVVGAGKATISELLYGAGGGATRPPTVKDLELDGITTIGTVPLLIGSPLSDEATLVTPAGSDTAVASGAAGAIGIYTIFGKGPPDAATYMLQPGLATPTPKPLVAVGDTVYGANLPMGTPQPSCKLVDSTAATTPLVIRGLGTVKNGAAEEVLAWSANGTLYKYSNAVFNSCGTGANQNALLALASLRPDGGAQILTIADGKVLLAGRAGEMGFLQLVSVAGAAMTPAGPPVMVPGMRTAAILDVAGTKYAITGAPSAPVGTAAAGQVVLYKVNDGGVDGTAVATLHDAQPEASQSFGRAVAAMPFKGKSTRQLIAIAGDNEIFVYYRVNLANGTALYDETREGR
jgi:hypothetical protein